MAVEVLNFGCRLNGVEAETIRGHATSAGAKDLVVVNTCAVTAEAGRQARQAVRRAARQRPGTRIVVTGCGAETETASYLAMPEVAAVLGNAEKMRPGMWARIADGKAAREELGSLLDQTVLPEAAHDAGAGRVRAFVAVQNGCDHRCTFCTIPAGRGYSRSAPIAAVIASARTALDAGAREIVLTGVDITAWGLDLDPALRLGALVKALLAAVPDLPRLRLSSLDSVEIDADLRDAIATEPRLMPHLHLSLQAGDDLILKRMKRRHSRDEAVRVCADLRRLRPDLVFGADIIAGFPTETEAMFGRSLDLVEACNLTHLHVFPYSARPGTPAARMPPVPSAIVRERAARLREVGEASLARHLSDEIGRIRSVLVEGSGTGHTEGFATVRFDSPPRKGSLLPVRILSQDGRALWGAPAAQG